MVHPAYQMDFIVCEPDIPIGDIICSCERESLATLGDRRRRPKRCRMMAKMFFCKPTYESTLQQCRTSSRRREDPSAFLNVGVIILKAELVVPDTDGN